MAHGKIRVNTLTYDTGSGDVDVAVSSIPDSSAMAAKADLASPALTGTPTAPTVATGTNNTQIATTAFVNAEIAADTAGKVNTSDIGSTVQAFDADTAKTDVAQTYTAGQRGEITTVTSSSGVLDIDFDASNNFYIELSENLTSVTATNPAVGQSGSIFIKQPASGGPYTVGGWAAAYLFSGAAAPTITATNGKSDRVDYVIRSATEIQVVWTGNY
jgi:hypothetical protein|tara:strand:+ start:519 stop:1166 length:648 start_codon:yes stop_codon:yes gene_type:complete